MSSGTSIYTGAVIQPTCTIQGWAFNAAGVYACAVSGKPVVCQAAELVTGGTNGTLYVHLINDPIGTWYPMPLTAGNRATALFDAIDDGGSITSNTGIILFPLVV